ncbi:hypothetical protein [Halomonas aquatica]|uniref:Uncharacterized protein n=1 Tax=Halomonas aquatica TaxID=3151123 RepID=A0ABV1NE36_9GAMM
MIGAAYALQATPIYRADALVQVENSAGMSKPPGRRALHAG